MDQFEKFCDNECGTQLTENEHIHCLRKGNREITFCSECRNDLWDELKKNGWECCDGDCDCELSDS